MQAEDLLMVGQMASSITGLFSAVYVLLLLNSRQAIREAAIVVELGQLLSCIFFVRVLSRAKQELDQSLASLFLRSHAMP
jgi:hypothetical protein